MFAVVCNNMSSVTCPLITMCEEEANNTVDKIVKDFIEYAKSQDFEYRQVDDSFTCKEEKENVIREVHLYMNDYFFKHIQIFEE